MYNGRLDSRSLNNYLIIRSNYYHLFHEAKSTSEEFDKVDKLNLVNYDNNFHLGLARDVYQFIPATRTRKFVT